MMQDIIKKRAGLINYFLHEDKEYSKEDILSKEFSVLSFSIRDELIDNIDTPFENLITPLNEIDGDIEELYVKGIVVDVDNRQGYSIIHIQNKNDNKSVSCSSEMLNRYGKYLETGHILLINCHSYNDRLYMHFMIDYSVDDAFVRETNYIDGTSINLIEDTDIALVKQATYFTSQKGNRCLRLSVHWKGQTKKFISCQNAYNTIPQDIVAGMFIKFDLSNETFINNIQEVMI